MIVWTLGIIVLCCRVQEVHSEDSICGSVQQAGGSEGMVESVAHTMYAECTATVCSTYYVVWGAICAKNT